MKENFNNGCFFLLIKCLGEVYLLSFSGGIHSSPVSGALFSSQVLCTLVFVLTTTDPCTDFVHDRTSLSSHAWLKSGLWPWLENEPDVKRSFITSLTIRPMYTCHTSADLFGRASDLFCTIMSYNWLSRNLHLSLIAKYRNSALITEFCPLHFT